MARRNSDPLKHDARVIIEDFLGIENPADPNDILPGVTTRQVHVAGIRKGELRPRAGFRILKFEA